MYTLKSKRSGHMHSEYVARNFTASTEYVGMVRAILGSKVIIFAAAAIFEIFTAGK